MSDVMANNGHNSVETVNSAAQAIMEADPRVQRHVVTKRRWGSCLSGYWCFGSKKQRGRRNHATILPVETPVDNAQGSIGQQPLLVPNPPLPFIAPPSSPASFLQSEPPSAIQSPAGFLSHCSLSPTGFSSSSHSIFSIGPYAHETQLVSPPVFSTFTTEPSTAPFTPPPETTTPSSPEVPFAKLLASALDAQCRASENGMIFPLPLHKVQYSEFQAYQLYPGSPGGQLISPSSVVSGSGTSSPFPNSKYPSNISFPACASAALSRDYGLPKFCMVGMLGNEMTLLPEPQKHDMDSSLSPSELSIGCAQNDTRQEYAHFLLDRPISAVASTGAVGVQGAYEEFIDHRVSFGLNTDEVVSCREMDRRVEEIFLHDSPVKVSIKVQTCDEVELEMYVESTTKNDVEGKIDQENSLSISLDVVPAGLLNEVEPVKEFKFDNADGALEVASIVTGTEWWSNETVAMQLGPKNWTLFSMIGPGVS